MRIVLYYFVRLAIDRKKKTFFSSQLDLLQVRLYYVTIVYDIIEFQIDLVILASSKNFVSRLDNFEMLFFFSRDFVLATSGLLFFDSHIRPRDFFE